MATDTLNLDVLHTDDQSFDDWYAAYEDTAQDRIRARNILADLTWGDWCLWQGWAVCGIDTLPADRIREARKLIVRRVRGNRIRRTPADPLVPILREGDLITFLDEDERTLWLNVYVNGRDLAKLAARRGWTLDRAQRVLRAARVVVEHLLPPDAVGPELVNGQARLTI